MWEAADTMQLRFASVTSLSHYNRELARPMSDKCACKKIVIFVHHFFFHAIAQELVPRIRNIWFSFCHFCQIILPFVSYMLKTGSLTFRKLN
jgi:hypothetical protein